LKNPIGIAVVTTSLSFCIGGTLGLLAGIGALAIPGVGPLIAALREISQRHSATPAQVSLASGRPVLIVPYAGHFDHVGRRVLIAWNATREDARALSDALPLLPPPMPGLRAARASLWMRLGECRERLRDAKGAVVAFEKALEADPARRPLRELLLERYGDDAHYDALVRQHRTMILQEEPLHAPSLRALAKIDARTGARDGGRRFLELLAVSGVISDEERHQLALLGGDLHAGVRHAARGFAQLGENLRGKFSGSISWYAETVKLDLEARKVIERTGSKPQKYRVK